MKSTESITQLYLSQGCTSYQSDDQVTTQEVSQDLQIDLSSFTIYCIRGNANYGLDNYQEALEYYN